MSSSSPLAETGGETAFLPKLRSLLGEVTTTPNRNGRIVAWVNLPDPAALVPLARALKQISARLSVITAFARDAAGVSPLAYTFDVEGNTVTLKLRVVPDIGVETIAPIFRNADWLEREVMELFDVRITGRPHNRRLFLDESVDGQAMERLLPLSIVSNAASTELLFDRIAEAAKAGHKDGGEA